MTDKSGTSVVEHSQLILGNSPKVPSWRREREKGTSTTKILKRGEKHVYFQIKRISNVHLSFADCVLPIGKKKR